LGCPTKVTISLSVVCPGLLQENENRNKDRSIAVLKDALRVMRVGEIRNIKEVLVVVLFKFI
jgi:hypothetical protein